MKAAAIPTKTLFEGCEYVPAARSDIRVRFQAIRAAQKAKEDPELVEQLSASVAMFKQRKASKK